MVDQWLEDNPGPKLWPPVPNIVHYILFTIHEVQFAHFISFLSVLKNQRPEVIYIHCDCHQLTGHYWTRALKVANKTRTLIIVRYFKRPEVIFGHKVSQKYLNWHSSDIARITVMSQFGGIYLDIDVYVTSPLDQYFDKELTIDFQKKGEVLGSQVIIGHKNARFLKLWLMSYQFYDPNEW